MRVIARPALLEFCARLPKGSQATARAAMSEWYTAVEAASWSNFADVKATFNAADYVTNGKVVFDVGGNKYRIVALVGFRTKRVFILFGGTHKEYDAVDVAKL
ncbi:type II toxin-antitoxin system HigB family toxin [Peteryoungia ipomoeae]|uniref:Type II toxin-antitoxin system HigB family toxin n=1 Tax=Peteryoungia ipomoeae TaxID=1210932 RepID=A0A4S8P2U1_9HYPH|nr:type II toxin-antitoxin system HigB family toxin [Peteryoungia ipomoeae]THV23092.1 type II toxin-antitoxin system HigB family toxin [Peteryoungia ipomoeae]